MISPRWSRTSAFVVALWACILVSGTVALSYPHGGTSYGCYYDEDCYGIQFVEWLSAYWPSAAAWSAVAALILAIIAYQQLRWNRQQAEATASAAEAARQAVQITKQDLELSHRAHLSIDRVDFTYLGANATLVIRKSGSMPATRINIGYRRTISPVPVRMDVSTFNISINPPFLGQIIAHNEPISIFLEISTEAFPEAERAEAVHPTPLPDGGQRYKEAILVGFMIAYWDGFRERRTWQAFVYAPATRSFHPYAGAQE